jgi:RNA polymerase sigma factor (sigma-70 family)
MQDPEDVQAWLDLEEQVRQMVHEHIPGLDVGATQEAVEQICVQVAADLGKALGPGSFQGFICGQLLTVRRRMLARAKTRRSDVPTEGFDVPNSLEEDPGELALALLAQCLGALPQSDRRAVELRYFQQASAAEIAIALGVPEGRARRIVYSGLAHLRSCMEARRA